MCLCLFHRLSELQGLGAGVAGRLSRLFDDVADRDGFVAVGAGAAEVEAGAGGVAIVAPLLAEVAGVAGRALVDGDGSSAGGLLKPTQSMKWP